MNSVLYYINVLQISTHTGKIECIDVRQDKILWKVDAHEKEVTGLSLSTSCPGLLVSASADGIVKVWDAVQPEVLEPVWEKKMNLGDLLCLAASPDSPFTFSTGGDNKSNNFKVWDLLDTPEGNRVHVLFYIFNYPKISNLDFRSRNIYSFGKIQDEGTRQDEK